MTASYSAGAFLQPIIRRLESIIERETMLKNIKSAHFTDGGTGITNFGVCSDTERDRLAPIYFEAIKRHGNDQYAVSMHPMNGSNARNGYSLHYLGAEMVGDASPFWRVFDQVRKEREPEVREMRIGGKIMKVTRTGDRFVIETDIGIESVALRFTNSWRA